LAPSSLVEAEVRVAKFLLWLILLVVCWPLALLALVLYPLVWLLLLPFRLLGIAVGGVLAFVKAVIFLPARLLRGPGAA
jgi:hypothetical protein